MSQTRWNGLQVALQQTFWPGKVPDDVKAHDVLNGIMTGIGVAASLLGGPYIGVMKELLNGLARSVDKRIKSSDESLAWMAKMEL
jgi:LytS/YehU family sensor histidine kinase